MKRIIIALVSLTAILSMASWRLNQPVHASSNGTLMTTLVSSGVASFNNGDSDITIPLSITLTIDSTAPVTHSGTATFKVYDYENTLLWSDSKQTSITASGQTIVSDTWTPDQDYGTTAPDNTAEPDYYTLTSTLTDDLLGYSPLNDSTQFGVYGAVQLTDTSVQPAIEYVCWMTPYTPFNVEQYYLQGMAEVWGCHNVLTPHVYIPFQESNQGEAGYYAQFNIWANKRYITGSARGKDCVLTMTCTGYTNTWHKYKKCWYYWTGMEATVTVLGITASGSAHSAGHLYCMT